MNDTSVPKLVSTRRRRFQRAAECRRCSAVKRQDRIETHVSDEFDAHAPSLRAVATVNEKVIILRVRFDV